MIIQVFVAFLLAIFVVFLSSLNIWNDIVGGIFLGALFIFSNILILFHIAFKENILKFKRYKIITLNTCLYFALFFNLIMFSSLSLDFISKQVTTNKEMITSIIAIYSNWFISMPLIFYLYGYKTKEIWIIAISGALILLVGNYLQLFFGSDLYQIVSEVIYLILISLAFLRKLQIKEYSILIVTVTVLMIINYLFINVGNRKLKEDCLNQKMDNLYCMEIFNANKEMLNKLIIYSENKNR